MKAMPDDSRLAIRLPTLGVALLAFGLGCHFWTDSVYRTAGLAIGTVQVCRYFLVRRARDNELEQKTETQVRWIKSCDDVTAMLLVAAAMHALAIGSR